MVSEDVYVKGNLGNEEAGWFDSAQAEPRIAHLRLAGQPNHRKCTQPTGQ
jgi:hypothetical protein